MDEHERHMRRAMVLAERGWGRVSPNPLVGAVIVRGGEVVGEGWHEGPGTDHAEVMALRAAGDRARDAVVYGTLEPCDRSGRTPPCTRALIQAGVARVVVATTDPHLGDDAPGLRALREAGITTSVGPLQGESRRMNEAFEHHVATARPFVTLKMAMSLDGKIAARDGTSRWITGEAARADAQRLRAGADAVIVGAGTALADRPSLTVRDPRFARARAPLRVVVDAAGRVPADGPLFDDAAATLVATGNRASRGIVDAWAATGADVAVLDEDAHGGLSLPELLALLGKRDAQGVVVEGGATLAGSFVQAGLVDKVVWYIAPLLVGGTEAPGALGGMGFAPIADARRLTVYAVDRVGEDLRVEAYVHRDR